MPFWIREADAEVFVPQTHGMLNKSVMYLGSVLKAIPSGERRGRGSGKVAQLQGGKSNVAGPIQLTPEELASVSGQLNGGAGSIEGRLAQLAGQVAPVGRDWAGTAQAPFLTLWQQWQTSSRQLHQALVGIARLGVLPSTTTGPRCLARRPRGWANRKPRRRAGPWTRVERPSAGSITAWHRE